MSIIMLSQSSMSRSISVLITQSRSKTKTHWAKLRRKTAPTDKAMKHFDDFYGSVFGMKWEPIKKALLMKHKYVAVVNNYGDADETAEILTNRGAHCMKKMIRVEKEFQDTYGPRIPLPDQQKDMKTSQSSIKRFSEKSQAEDIASIYPEGEMKPETLETPGMKLSERKADNKDVFDEKKSTPSIGSLEKSISEAELDDSRVIDASMGMSAGALWQYVPATKLKGMEDWVPESQHYAYYTKGKDFPLFLEPENDFTFPDHLKVFTYEMENTSLFPEPKRSKTGVYNYYPMDGASILPVLALGLQGGERMLDLCAAPGGKALAALQTLLPDIVVANDASISRANRIQRVFKDYLYDFEDGNKWRERTIITRVDGRTYRDEQLFDKVLVDVPCTTDRHAITESENNIFRADRVKERLKIPELQSQLLVNALSLVRVGGTVVYSTCSLSPIQNDGVVHMALKQAFEQHGVEAIIKDLTACMAQFWGIFRFGMGRAAPRYGQLVTPHVDANFGPAYFAKIVRTR